MTSDNIFLKDFITAAEKVAPFIIKTSLKKSTQLYQGKTLYIKKESNQKTGSFKWRGVLFTVLTAFEKLKDILDTIDLNKNYYMVTQSTGNHGIATLRAIRVVKQYFINIYPESKHYWEKVHPGIFANQLIPIKKLRRMKEELASYGTTVGFVDSSFNNYATALIARTEFLKHNQGQYMSHGGKDILTGYGSLALEIHQQLPQGDRIALYVAVGAGGPIGIGACLKQLRDTHLVIAQTESYNAFVRSLDTGKLETNNCQNTTDDVSDGIAVDQPEYFAFKLAQTHVDKAISVDANSVRKKVKLTGLGGSSCISLCAVDAYIPEDIDSIVVLDCEGNN